MCGEGIAKPLRVLLRQLFGFDPVLQEASDKTDQLEAHLEASIDTGTWMLSCKPKDISDTTIECDNGRTYKKEE